MEKINLYALKDNEQSFYTGYLMAKDDRAAIKYYGDSLENVLDIAVSNGDKKISDLVSRFRNTAVYKLGSIDPDTGELSNDLIYLTDFREIKLKSKEEKS